MDFSNLAPGSVSAFSSCAESSNSRLDTALTEFTNFGSTGTIAESASSNDSGIQTGSSPVPSGSIPSTAGCYYGTSRQLQHLDGNQEDHTALVSHATQVQDQVLSQRHPSVSTGMPQLPTPGQDSRQSVQPGCKCMKGVLYLVNDLETSMSTDSLVDDMSASDDSPPIRKAIGLDSALGNHRDALRYGESIRQCPICASSIENSMSLHLLVNRLIALCAHMVVAYRSLAQANDNDPTGARNGPESPLSITVGEYEVESTVESHAVLRQLLAFQLRSLHTFAASLENSENRVNVAAFRAAKNKAAKLWLGLQQNSTLLPL